MIWELTDSAPLSPNGFNEITVSCMFVRTQDIRRFFAPNAAKPVAQKPASNGNNKTDEKKKKKNLSSSDEEVKKKETAKVRTDLVIDSSFFLLPSFSFS